MNEIVTLSVNGIVKSKSQSDLMNGVVTLGVKKEYGKYVSFEVHIKYRTRAIITRSWSVTTLVYKPRILGLKNEEFPFLVHKFSVV